MLQVKSALRRIFRWQVFLPLAILLVVLGAVGGLSLFCPYSEVPVLILPAGEELQVRAYIAPEVSNDSNHWETLIYRDGAVVTRAYTQYVSVAYEADQEWIEEVRNFWGTTVRICLHLRPDHRW